MKKIIGFVLTLTLIGCADTPENRQLWLGIASGMQSAGQEMGRGAQDIRNNLNQQARQPYPPLSTPMNCVTQYEKMFNAYRTVCH
jgi:hypothetical protein